MNERDSESIACILSTAGHILVTSESAADLVILNTCSVREQAEIKAIGKSGFLARRKRNNPNFRIGIVGCMAENLGEHLLYLNPLIDFIVGPQRLNEISEIIENDKKGTFIGVAKNCITVPAQSNPLSKFGRNFDIPKTTAFVSIMQGCNMRCSYCIVPKTRGTEVYRSMDDIIAEIEILSQHGINEITLLGQIVNNYGGRIMPTLDGKSPFVQLLDRIQQIKSIVRIRYMSPHPRYFSEDLIAAHRNMNKLCPSVHLPIQSGSDRILHEMGRCYDRKKVSEIVKKLRQCRTEMSITTDIIVGYPGETTEDFEQTVSLFDELKFNMAYVFKYSPRRGTKSANCPDDVSEEEKNRRNKILLGKVEEYSRMYNQKFCGTTVDVLVEGFAKRGENMMFGYTQNRYKVLFPCNKSDIGKILRVRIEKFSTTVLLGTVVSE